MRESKGIVTNEQQAAARSPQTSRLALSFDVGGTFTDFTLLDLSTGRVVAEHKVLTDPADPARSSLAGWRDLIAAGHLDPARLALVVHATTLVTNAVIERKGSPTALLTTAGFKDLLTFGREQMYDIYDLFAPPAEPLVPPRWRVEARERITRDGEPLQPLDPAQVVEAVRPAVDEGVEAVAVGFLHSYLDPTHEEEAAAALRAAFPDIECSLSSRVAPLMGEFERFTTTTADAYVKRLVRHAIGNLAATLHAEGLPKDRDIHIMTSAGGIVASAEATERPIRLLESGPAAGALAAAFHGQLGGKDRVISLDMGGTTAKACLIDSGRPALASMLEAARVHRFKPGSGLPVVIPVVDLIEIGAGGGSIARIDELGLLKVGPDSAGASPGPACYGLGGDLPTVTDANLLLGYLGEESFLGGRLRLDRDAAEAAVGRLAGAANLSLMETAWGIHRVANEAMSAAARIHAIEKNRDPRGYTLLAFGGAGPAHAMAVARILGMQEVVFPPGAGVASALGCLVAPPSLSLARTMTGRLAEVDWTAVARLFEEMEGEAQSALAAAGVSQAEMCYERSVDLRLEGQYHELTLPVPAWEKARPPIDPLAASFAAAYRDRYGRLPAGLPVEAITWRLEARGPDGGVRLMESRPSSRDASSAICGERTAHFGGNPEAALVTPVYDRSRLAPGICFEGPAIVEEAHATTVIHPGDRVEVNPYGAMIVTVGGNR